MKLRLKNTNLYWTGSCWAEYEENGKLFPSITYIIGEITNYNLKNYEIV